MDGNTAVITKQEIKFIQSDVCYICTANGLVALVCNGGSSVFLCADCIEKTMGLKKCYCHPLGWGTTARFGPLNKSLNLAEAFRIFGGEEFGQIFTEF